MKVSLIVAIAKNRAIGKNNDLLWRLPADMKFFKNTTLGHCIITGRKNYESIPKKFRPLPNRTNIVLTRNPDFYEENIVLTNSLNSAWEEAKKRNETEVFIIGGGQIYREALEQNLVDSMYITHVNASFEDADTFFPEFNASHWDRESLMVYSADEKNPYDFEIIRYQK